MMYSLPVFALAVVSAFAAPVFESQSESPVSQWKSFSDMNIWEATIPNVKAFLANSIYALAADTDDKFKDQGDALIEDVNAFTRAGGSDVNFHWVSEWDRNLETFMTSTISGDRLTEEQRRHLAPLMKKIWISLTTKIASTNLALSQIPEFVVHAAPQADRLYADAVQAFREKASNLVEKREGSIHQDTDESATKDILHQLNVLTAGDFYELQPVSFMVLE